MIVLGIDPGSRRCGYGVVARRGGRLVVLASGVLAPGERPMAERLAAILDGLAEVIRRTRPVEVSVEQVFSGVSARSALVLGQARGVALAAAARAGLPVHEYAPAQVKLAFTGSGRASKEQMVRTARMLLGTSPRLPDEADALAIAVCHLARRAGRPVPSVQPPSPRPSPPSLGPGGEGGAGNRSGQARASPLARDTGKARASPLAPRSGERGTGPRAPAVGRGATSSALARLRPSRRDHRGVA